VGCCETRDKGCAPVAGFCENRDKCGLQWRVTAKPGTRAGLSGGLLGKQRQWRAPVAGYCETEVVNQSHYRPEVPGGFQDVKVPRLRDNDPGWW